MWNTSFELALGGCCVSKCCVCFSSFYVVSDEFSDGVGYPSVCVRLSISVCMLSVSNALLMSNATVIVRSGGRFWLKPVAIVLLMRCSAVSVECLLLYPCCVVRNFVCNEW